MQGRWRGELAVVVAVGLPFIFLGLNSISFLDPDEGMYGSIAREMAKAGDWMTPHFDGVRYLEKPPLQFWLSALTIAVFGPSEWAVRLWSALPAFGTSLLLWRMGGWLYGRQGGLLAAIIFSSAVGVFRYSHVAATDFLLVFSITLAIFGFLKVVRALGEDSGLRGKARLGTGCLTGAMVFYLGLAAGVLSKGLIGLVFPLMIMGFFLPLHGSMGKAEGPVSWAHCSAPCGWFS